MNPAYIQSNARRYQILFILIPEIKHIRSHFV